MQKFDYGLITQKRMNYCNNIPRLKSDINVLEQQKSVFLCYQIFRI